MAEQPDPEQIALMKRVVELAERQTALSVTRTQQSAERSRMSAERSEMSAERSYMNAERTLSVWIRTALAVIVVGIAVDRFGLLLAQDHATRARSDSASHWVGAGLVAFGILVSVVTGARFWLYAAVYRRTHELPHHHGPFMAPAFAALAALFGIIILILVILSP